MHFATPEYSLNHDGWAARADPVALSATQYVAPIVLRVSSSEHGRGGAAMAAHACLTLDKQHDRAASRCINRTPPLRTL